MNECFKALASKLSSSSGVASQLKAVKDQAEAQFELISIVEARPQDVLNGKLGQCGYTYGRGRVVRPWRPCDVGVTKVQT